jgi:type VI protein secretion system component Hcp
MKIINLKKSALILEKKWQGIEINLFAIKLGGFKEFVTPKISAFILGSILGMMPASYASAEDLKKIGTVMIPELTQQPAPIFSVGVQYSTTPSSGGGAGMGRSEFTPFTLIKKVDAASPKLLVDVASGRHIPQVSVDVFAPNGTTVLNNYELTDVVPLGSAVKSVQDGNNRVLVEEVTFQYGMIKQTVFSPTGAVQECWNKAENKAC